MRKCISLNSFQAFINLLDMMVRLGLLEPASFIVTWEKKPRLTLNRLGGFEFENPQEVYGMVITFWDEFSNVICNKRFMLAEKFDDDE